MDKIVARSHGPATSDGPFEAGVRAVVVLCAARPQSFETAMT